MKGFTLIELLIVVAIIGILAAIAIPNFLAAQTRAKVSRVMADQQAVSTALETYRVDYNGYPVSAIPLGQPGGGVALEPKILKLVPLTTPIPYISSVPIDTFHPKRRDPASGCVNYQDRWSYFASGRYCYDLPERAGEINWFLEPPRNHEYYLICRGPSGRKPSAFPYGIDERFCYDPTNGTISNGNVCRLGPRG